MRTAPSSPHQNLLTCFQVFLLTSKAILQIPKILDLRFQRDVSIRIRHMDNNSPTKAKIIISTCECMGIAFFWKLCLLPTTYLQEVPC